MNYYKTQAQDYIDMAKGYDGQDLINKLKTYLDIGKSVLEIGMGPGVDLDILGQNYRVIGSDAYESFIDLYKDRGGQHVTMLLDAEILDTEIVVDCIYSNKVLQHFDEEQLVNSFKNQAKRLTEGGLILHSFWKGSHVEEIAEMTFYYYEPYKITDLLDETFEVLETVVYEEMGPEDSFYIIARKR